MSNRPHSLYLILARAGSKRLPRKNVRAIGGIPLVGRAVRTARWAAQRLGNPADVVVSTEDVEIARLAQQWGAEVPFLRPAPLATDEVPSVAVLRHALAVLENAGRRYTEIVHLQPTAPLTLPVDVLRTVRMLRTDPSRSAVTVQQATEQPAGIRFGVEDGLLIDDAASLTAAARVALNGAVYAFTPDWLLHHERLAEPRATRAVTMPAPRCADIDTGDDLQDVRFRWQAHVPWRRAGGFVVAEAIDHRAADPARAQRIVEIAHRVGIDAVTFAPADFAARDDAAFSSPSYEELAGYCAAREIVPIPQIQHQGQLEALDARDPPILWLDARGDEALLRHAAATGRPLLVARGDGTMPSASIEAALRNAACTEFILLDRAAGAGDALRPRMIGAEPARERRVIVLGVPAHLIERDNAEGLRELRRAVETARCADAAPEPARGPAA